MIRFLKPPAGVSLYVNGSAAAPSVAGANFMTTGLYWTAGPQLNISTGGTQRAQFDSSGLTLPNLTSGSVLFSGAAGLISQSNANFFWDNTNLRLGLGTAGPQRSLHLASSGGSFIRLERTSGSGASGTVVFTGAGAIEGARIIGSFANTVDASSEIQFWTHDGTALGQRAVILNTGNFGLAVSVPAHLFDISLGTITSQKAIYNAIGTWNAAGVTFSADILNITDTASAAASLLWDRQVGGSSKGKLDKAGAMTLAAGLTATTGTFSAAVSLGNTVNVVSPTAPNRTVTISIGGTTYYLAAKTTND